MSGDNSDHEWAPLLSSTRSPTTTQSIKKPEPAAKLSGSKRSVTIMPLAPIARPVESTTLFTATSPAFVLSNSVRRTTYVPKAGPQLTEHPGDQPATGGDSVLARSGPLFVHRESP